MTYVIEAVDRERCNNTICHVRVQIFSPNYARSRLGQAWEWIRACKNWTAQYNSDVPILVLTDLGLGWARLGWAWTGACQL